MQVWFSRQRRRRQEPVRLREWNREGRSITPFEPEAVGFPGSLYRAASVSEHPRRTELAFQLKSGHFMRWIMNKNSNVKRSSCARTRALSCFLAFYAFPGFDK